MGEGLIMRKGRNPITRIVDYTSVNTLTVSGLGNYENFILVAVPVGTNTGVGDDKLMSLFLIDGLMKGSTAKASYDVSAATVDGDVITFSGGFASYLTYYVTMW